MIRSGWLMMMSLALMFAGSCVNGEFIVNKTNPSLTAQVDKPELMFDNITLGNSKDYSKQKKFGMVIGGCNMSIVAGSLGETIAYDVKYGSEKVSAMNLAQINAAENEGITFYGKDGDPKSLKGCQAAFTPVDDKYSVNVQLSGDGMPPNLVLSASSARVYVPSPTEPSASGDETKKGSKGDNPDLPVILGVVGGIVALLLIGFVIGIIMWCIRRRNKRQKRLKEEQENAPPAIHGVEEGTSTAGKAQAEEATLTLGQAPVDKATTVGKEQADRDKADVDKQSETTSDVPSHFV